MLSTGDHLDPSCSSDECAAHQVKLDEVPTPNFSIRNYVFEARSKGVEKNWPFRSQLLHLCLKNGVEDLLPPFEPPDSARAQSSTKNIELDRPIKSSETGRIPSSAELERKDAGDPNDIAYLKVENGGSSSELNYGNGQGERVLDLIIPANNSVKEVSSELEITEPLPFERKSKLVAEKDLFSNSSSVLESMASKICPVCKTFSSTSNTTLNAHIDQCLAAESNAQQVMTESSKFKVKPRKKRLMVDIYKSAPLCTLEDLDRRNGTNWASGLAFVAAACEDRNEAQQLRTSPLDYKEGDSEGAVYVDSNGVKIRILSKCNDAQQQSLMEEFRTRKVSKVKSSKNSLISEMQHFGRKQLKNKKLRLQQRKIRSFKNLNNQIRSQTDGSSTKVDYHQAEYLSDLSNFPNQSVKSGTPNLRQWACSKRSNIVEKPSNEDTYETGKDLSAKTKSVHSLFNVASMMDDEMTSSDHSISSSKSEKSCDLKKCITARSPFHLLEAQNGDSSEKATTCSEKFRKHRSLSRTRKRRGEASPSGNIERANKNFRILNPNVLESDIVSKTGNALEHVSPRETNMHESEEREDQYEVRVQESRATEGEIIGGNMITDSINFENEKPPPFTEIANEESRLQKHVELRGERDSFTVPIHEESASLIGCCNIRFEAPQDRSSITSIREASNNDHSLVFDGESLTSPISSASTMSLPSLEYSKFKVSDSDQLAEATASKSNLELLVASVKRSRGTEEQKLEKSANQRVNDDKPFCCSCRESLSKETQLLRQSEKSGEMLASKGMQVSKGRVGLRSASSFSSYHSLRTKYLAESTGNSSADINSNSCGPSSQNQIPSPSNPVLRLMGKNLVVNKEEIGQPQTPNSPLMTNHQIPPQQFQGVGFHGTSFHSGLIANFDQNSMEKSHKKLVPPSQIEDEPNGGLVLPRSASATAILMSNPMPPAPFSYFPFQNQFSPTDATSSGSRLLLPNLYPTVSVNSLMNPGTAFEGPGAFLPRPFILQSPTYQLSPFMYHSQSFR